LQFRSTGIPVCTWFFAKDKTAGEKSSIDRTGQVLFIDARNLGTMVDRAERALTDDDIAKITGTHHAWRGTPSAADAGLAYADEPGFSNFGVTEGDLASLAADTLADTVTVNNPIQPTVDDVVRILKESL
jgi:type I restriction enzyme M protein